MRKLLKSLKKNGWVGSIGLLIFLIRTKIIFPKARLIRFPFRIRGKRFISIGKNFTTGFNCRIDAFPITDNEKICISIGDNCQINDYVHIAAIDSITIGNNVLIASRVFISDHDHGSYGENDIHSSPLEPPNNRTLYSKKVIVEDNVWIGENVSILKGSIIGTGAVIGTNSVITKSIPPYSIALGIPARIIKSFNFENKKWEKI